MHARLPGALLAVVAGSAVVLATGCAAPIRGTAVAAPTADRPSSTAPTTSPTTSVPPPNRPERPEPTRAGWQVVVDPLSGLAYDVPPDWTGGFGEVQLPSGPLGASSSVASYDCGGLGFIRGVTAAGTRPPGDLAQTATALAQEIGMELYSTAGPVQVAVGPARPLSQGGVPAVVVDAVVTSPPDPCLATSGAVTVLVLDAGTQQQVFFGNVDLAGGPPEPAPRVEQELREIAATVRQAG